METDRNCRYIQQCGHTWYVFQILGTTPLLQSWPRSGSVTSWLILPHPRWIWILLKKVFSNQSFPGKAVSWNSKLRLRQFTSTILNKQASTLFMYNRKGKKSLLTLYDFSFFSKLLCSLRMCMKKWIFLWTCFIWISCIFMLFWKSDFIFFLRSVIQTGSTIFFLRRAK